MECLTCHGQHLFRPDKIVEKKKRVSEKAVQEKAIQEPSEKPKGAKGSQRRGESRLEKLRIKNEEIWRAALFDRDLGAATSYAMSSSYQVDEIIDHATFGIGLITRIVNTQKIEVLFKDGYRFLVQGRH